MEYIFEVRAIHHDHLISPIAALARSRATPLVMFSISARVSSSNMFVCL